MPLNALFQNGNQKTGFLVFWFSGFLVFWFSGFLVFWFSAKSWSDPRHWQGKNATP